MDPNQKNQTNFDPFDRVAITRLCYLGASGLTSELCQMTLTSIRNLKGIRCALQAAKKYVLDWPTADGLIFSGEYGSGKTHLACGIALALMEKLVPVRYVDVRAYLKAVRRQWNVPRDEIIEEAFFDPLDGDLLILDDLADAGERMQDWQRDELYQVLEPCYLLRKPVIVTTNCKQNELRDQIGGRLYDRLLHRSRWIDNDAESYRVKEHIDMNKEEAAR